MNDDERRVVPRIMQIRARRVVLDSDLARLYGVTTSRFNEAFKRNRRCFPSEFAFQLTPVEFAALRSRARSTASQTPDSYGGKVNLWQIAIGSQKQRDPRLRPWAFTERGALMTANILRTDRAIQMSVFVIVRLFSCANVPRPTTQYLKRLAEIDGVLLKHDTALRDIYLKLLPLLQPPADPPKPRIGF